MNLNTRRKQSFITTCLETKNRFSEKKIEKLNSNFEDHETEIHKHYY